jgi:hypothetical protein
MIARLSIPQPSQKNHLAVATLSYRYHYRKTTWEPLDLPWHDLHKKTTLWLPDRSFNTIAKINMVVARL